ncbi:MAG: small subunit ribosomal protein S11 [Parcubacteria group bacterium LiPW_39]|nr:MAG: small subunit ribosomal protein S11 [Parcubacteria group bacterium LiPW_39]
MLARLALLGKIGMGKKKIQSQSEQEVLKEKEIQESAQKKAVASTQAKTKRVDKGQVYIQSTYNNTIVTVCDSRGDVLAWASAGALGFRGPKKATPYAASRTVETLIEKVRKLGLTDVNVLVKGIGSGREAAVRALASHGLNILSIKDITPVPHNGCRPRKVRRV